MKEEIFKKITGRSGYDGVGKIHRGEKRSQGFILKDKFWWRQKMVKYAQEHRIAASARELEMTKKTVRLWLYGYLKNGVKGLLDRPRAPKWIPHKTSVELEDKVVQLKRRYFTFSASRLTSSRGFSPREGVL